MTMGGSPPGDRGSMKWYGLLVLGVVGVAVVGVGLVATLVFVGVLNDQPTATATVSPTAPSVGETVEFNASATVDHDGTTERYEWAVDGETVADGKIARHTFESAGEHTVRLEVTDDDGAQNSTSMRVTVNDVVTAERGMTEARWSSPDTWGGEKPSAGETVRVPEDTTVVLDESPPELSSIIVDGGTLRFARENLSLRTGAVVVKNRGRLQIGTEDDPFEQEATITLTGRRGDEGVLDCGTKTLCARGGQLSVHGAVDGPTWTTLDGTAEAGDSTITLAEPVAWEAGDEIVLPSTSLDPGAVDRRRIAGVDGRTVELDQPLEHTHYGELQTFGPRGEYEVDERGEVLHLTRNVVIQGDESSDVDRFGGHIMAMNEHHHEQVQRAAAGENWTTIWDENRNDPALLPRLSGVELRRMGQEGVLARYPFHWHRYGNADGSYLRNASIHDTYQRCVTIHGTQQATVANTVAFDVTGHCYFLEEGTEDGTRLRANVGALVKPFSSENRTHILSDSTPSVFWTNGPPNSTVVDNVAAGAYGNGFWVDLENNGGHPARLNEPLGTWDGNTAHSIHSNDPDGEQNIRMSQSPRDHINTTGGGAFFIEGGEGNLSNLTAYKSPVGFWNDDATNIVVQNATVADTRNALWFQDGGVDNSTVVAHTDNTGPLETAAERRRGYTLPEPGSTRMGSAESVTGVVSFYQGARVKNTAFIGYETDDSVPHGVFGTMQGIRSNPYFAAGNRLVDSRPYLPDLPKEGRELEVGARVIPSADGGIVGEYEDEFRLSEFDGSEYRELRWGSDHLTDRAGCEPIDHIDSRAGHEFDRSVYSCPGRSVSLSYPDGAYSVDGTTYEGIGGKRGYLEANQTYRYQGTLSPEFVADHEGDLRIHRGYPGDYVVFAFPMAEKPELSQVGQPAAGELVEVNSREAVRSEENLENSRYYWDSGEKTLWLRVVTHPEKANEFGTLPFKDKLGLPIKRARDNGILFE